MKYPLFLPTECDVALDELSQMPWSAGKAPNPEYQNLKQNSEFVLSGNGIRGYHALDSIIPAIMGCNYLATRTMPKKIGHARFTSYKDGGEYKKQFEPAFYGTESKIRTDLAVTVFLSDPDTYEGGELILDYPSGAMISLKEQQGTLVYYPAGVMHRIMPVTDGARYTFDAFIESHIQDPQKREIISEMEAACAEMESIEPLGDLNLRMANIKHNLYRQWMTTT